MKKASEEPKKTAKSGQKKQSISGQQQQREKEPVGAETDAGGCNKPVSQNFCEKKKSKRPAREAAHAETCDTSNLFRLQLRKAEAD